MSGFQRRDRQPLSWTPDPDEDAGSEAGVPLREAASLESRNRRPALPQSRVRPRAMAAAAIVLLGAAGGASLLFKQDEARPAQPAFDDAAASSGSVSPKAARLAIGAEAPVPTDAQPVETPTAAAAPAPQPDLLSEPVQVASAAPSEPIAVTPAPPAPLPEVPAAPADPSAAAGPLSDPAPVQAVEPAAPEAPQPRAQVTMSAAEIESHLARAEQALRSGDLAVARSFFGRVFNARDPRGALGMARTYDTAELKKLPVFGQKADQAEADRWNALAQELREASSARLN